MSRARRRQPVQAACLLSGLRSAGSCLPFLLPPLLFAMPSALAQAPDGTAQQIATLTAAMAKQQQQLEKSEAAIRALQQQLAAMQAQMSAAREEPESASAAHDAAALARQVALLREQQELQSSELGTHEQTKVESASKYPVVLTGLILANAFQNSGGVDVIQSPALAVGGPGTTGFSLRQTVLGLDAQGAHLFGGAARADLRVDFFGDISSGVYGSGGGIPRLRTAHAVLDWPHAQAFFVLDRPLFSPNTPTSLTAIAQPALAWSGNLWNWLPQVGAEYRRSLSYHSNFSVQGAFLDVADPPSYTNAAAPASNTLPATNAASYAEQSRWPGSEAHLSYGHGDSETGFRLGAGGYFSPHEAAGAFRYDAWASTLDYRVPLSHHLEASGAFYRGLALGGLGGGAYKDAVFMYSPAGQYVFIRPLDDVGGWSQLEARAGLRWQFNADFGLDNAFASELRPSVSPAGGSYAALVRNATFFSNAIYSPTASTAFSFEYRRLNSSPAAGNTYTVNVYGLAAGYKF